MSLQRSINPNSYLGDVGRRLVAYCQEVEQVPAKREEAVNMLQETLKIYIAGTYFGGRGAFLQERFNKLHQTNEATTVLQVVQACLLDKEAGVEASSFITLLLRALSKKVLGGETDIAIHNIGLLKQEFLNQVPNREAYKNLIDEEQREVDEQRAHKDVLKQENAKMESMLAQKNDFFLNLVNIAKNVDREIKQKTQTLQQLLQSKQQEQDALQALTKHIQQEKEAWENKLQELSSALASYKAELSVEERRFNAAYPVFDYKEIPIELLEKAVKHARESLDDWRFVLMKTEERKKQEAEERLAIKQKPQQTPSEPMFQENKQTKDCILKLVYAHVPADEEISDANVLYLYYVPQEDGIAYAVKEPAGVGRYTIETAVLGDKFEIIRNILKDKSVKRTLDVESSKLVFDAALKHGYAQKIDARYVSSQDKINEELDRIKKNSQSSDKSYVREVLKQMHKEAQDKAANLNKVGAHARMKSPEALSCVAVDKSYYPSSEVQTATQEESKEIKKEQVQKRMLLNQGLKEHFKLFGNKQGKPESKIISEQSEGKRYGKQI